MIDSFWQPMCEGMWGAALAALWGALWGSFFNVVVVRVPAGESLVKPPSHCRSCREPLRWYDNVPILGFVVLRGRCRHCGAGFSARYLVTELLVAALALGCHQVFIVGVEADLGLRVARFVIASLFCGLFVALALIDLETGLLPKKITIPAIPVAAGLSVFMGHPRLWDGLLGALVGFALIEGLNLLWVVIRKRDGFGGGDWPLLATIGGLLGWRAVLPVMMLASLQGSLIGIPWLAVQMRRARREVDDGSDGKTDSSCGQDERPIEGSIADEVERDVSIEDGAVDDSSVDDPSTATDWAQQASLRRAMLPFGPFLSLSAIELLMLHEHLPALLPIFY